MKHRGTQFLVILAAVTGFAMTVNAQTLPPVALGPCPTALQRSWQQMEMYAFVHFSLNTWTNQSWGYGNEDISLFNPDDLDCRQWARICRDAGMKGIIITAKHHSGFCLWPSKYTAYSVKNTPWKDGKGDVVAELAEACREYGLKFGVYLSPWDRHDSRYGSPAYITYFRDQLTELLTNYGPVFEVWFDGAQGGSGYYGGANDVRKIDARSYYQWSETYRLIRSLQPECVIWNDGGDRGDLRWVGTEEGFVGETNWSTLNASGEVTWPMLHYGLEGGDAWVPAEVNTSIRPEWFYHPEEDERVKPVAKLLDIYYSSVGRNASLLLNFPIMPNGRIHETDEKNALAFASVIKRTFANNLLEGARIEASNTRGDDRAYAPEHLLDGKDDTYWASDDGVHGARLVLDLPAPVWINRFMAQEYIPLGQRVRSFTVEALVGESWQEVARGTTIGYKRLFRFPAVFASKICVNIQDSRGAIVLSALGAYSAPVLVPPPEIRRNRNGDITLHAVDPGPLFHYTLDGSSPSTTSPQYTGPIASTGKVVVRAISRDPVSGAMSEEAAVSFDISREKWRILHTDDPKAYDILDGSPDTVWHQFNLSPRGRKRLPVDLVLDLGEEVSICGVTYCPDQSRWPSGIMTRYEILLSTDNQTWVTAQKGEFANIKNNPIRQSCRFAPMRARYITLRGHRNTQGDGVMGYAEFGVITEDD